MMATKIVRYNGINHSPSDQERDVTCGELIDLRTDNKDLKIAEKPKDTRIKLVSLENDSNLWSGTASNNVIYYPNLIGVHEYNGWKHFVGYKKIEKSGYEDKHAIYFYKDIDKYRSNPIPSAVPNPVVFPGNETIYNLCKTATTQSNNYQIFYDSIIVIRNIHKSILHCVKNAFVGKEMDSDAELIDRILTLNEDYFEEIEIGAFDKEVNHLITFIETLEDYLSNNPYYHTLFSSMTDSLSDFIEDNTITSLSIKNYAKSLVEEKNNFNTDTEEITSKQELVMDDGENYDTCVKRLLYNVINITTLESQIDLSKANNYRDAVEELNSNEIVFSNEYPGAKTNEIKATTINSFSIGLSDFDNNTYGIFSSGEEYDTIESISDYADDLQSYYIYLTNGSISFYYASSEDNGAEDIGFLFDEEPVDITTIGLSVIITFRTHTNYFYFKDGVYKHLGTKPNIPNIYFSIENINIIPPFEYDKEEVRCKESDGDFYNYEGILYNNTNNVSQIIGGDKKYNLNAVIENINGKILQFESDCIIKNKIPANPFFLRYAVRLKTGVYVNHSQPFLIFPFDKMPFYVEYRITHNEQGSGAVKGINPVLKGKTFTDNPLRMFWDECNFGNWEDIVESVDIFMSEPIRKYRFLKDGDTMFTNEMFDGTPSSGIWSFKHQTPIPIHELSYHSGDTIPNSYLSDIIETNDNDFKEQLSEVSVFYKVNSIKLSELKSLNSNGKNVIESSDILQTLTSRQQLTDDYDSLNDKGSNCLYSYNQRLITGGLTIKPFNGYSLSTYRDVRYYDYNKYIKEVKYYLRKDTGWICLQNSTIKEDVFINLYNNPYYLYYPDKDCKYIEITYSDNNKVKYRMTPHPYLNGAYCNNMYEAETTEDILPESNFVYTYQISSRFRMSNPSDPFYFSIDNMVDIGNRDIRQFATNTNEVSMGQFGQYPIYAYTGDGVYGVNVDSAGNYAGLTTISSDVVKNMTSIANRPVAMGNRLIFFVTDNSVLVQEGLKVTEISEVLEGQDFNPIDLILSNGNDIYSSISGETIISNALTDIKNACGTTAGSAYTFDTAFWQLKGISSLVYDNKHNRLIMYNNAKRVAYTFYLSEKSWARQTMPFLINTAVNNYTECYVQMNGDNVYDFMADVNENNSNTYGVGMAVSNALRFDTDEFKKITSIIHDGTFRRANSPQSAGGKTYIALYVSRDGKDYYKLESLRGASFKYMKIVIYLYMLPSMRYSQTKLEIIESFRNRIR